MNPLYLRIDVCTYRGFRDGVPGVLEILKQVGARATFCVSMGPDASGLAMIKMLNPAFAWKMLTSKAVGTYGLATAFYGTLLPSPSVGSGNPDLLRRIQGEGHEVIPHGWDHRRWQDRMPKMDRARLESEFREMLEGHRDALGKPAAGFASPAWMVTPELLNLEQKAGLAFASDCRGREPFLPVFDGHEFAVPQLPVTLPTLDEALAKMSREDFVAAILRDSAAQPGWCCFTAHAESEGREYRAELEAILSKVGRPVRPLGDAPRTGLPRRELKMGRVEGRPYDVCVQAN